MGDKRLILHIEDEVEISKLVADILSHPQLDFLTAPDGATGLAIAAEHRPDLILLDIMLPEMDGYQVYEQLRSSPETAGIPVIMVTVKNRPHEKTRAKSIQGLKGYVGKPFSVTELREQITRQLGIAY
jgi:DNA-binding response OmpR family regulator